MSYWDDKRRVELIIEKYGTGDIFTAACLYQSPFWNCSEIGKFLKRFLSREQGGYGVFTHPQYKLILISKRTPRKYKLEYIKKVEEL